MYKRMGSSIQEYCKKINSAITINDIVSLFLTCLFLSGLTVVIHHRQSLSVKEVIYQEATDKSTDTDVTPIGTDISDTRPFGSIHGKTYTFSWCQGSKRILQKNRVYFVSATEADQSHRTLSLLCKK